MAGGAVLKRSWNQLDDRALVEHATAQDHGAFDEIVVRYQQPLRDFCIHLGANDLEAAEATQTAFIAAWSAIETNQPRAELKSWLFGIAANKLRTHWRPGLTLVEIDETLPSSADGPDDVVIRRSELRETLGDIAHLPSAQRVALERHVLQDLDYQSADVAESARRAVTDARRSLIDTRRGRALACSTICASIDAGDRRSLRARDIRAHLDSCSSCQNYAAATTSRQRRRLALTALPTLAWSLLRRRAKHLKRVKQAGTGIKTLLFTKAAIIVLTIAGTVGAAIVASRSASPPHSSVAAAPLGEMSRAHARARPSRSVRKLKLAMRTAPHHAQAESRPVTVPKPPSAQSISPKHALPPSTAKSASISTTTASSGLDTHDVDTLATQTIVRTVNTTAATISAIPTAATTVASDGEQVSTFTPPTISTSAPIPATGLPSAP